MAKEPTRKPKAEPKASIDPRSGMDTTGGTSATEQALADQFRIADAKGDAKRQALIDEATANRQIRGW